MQCKPEAVLLYHANLHHFSLSSERRNHYTARYLAEMVQQIRVPSAISLPAEDLVYLRMHYPETYSDLLSNPHVTFLYSTFAHVIAGLDSQTYGQQVDLGTALFKKNLPSSRIVDIGYPSEVEVPPLLHVQRIKELWGALILGETRFYPKDLSDHFQWHPTTTVRIPTIVSRRRTAYRDAFHRFFREDVPPEDVTRALQEDTRQWSAGLGHLARIDMETPVLNEVTFPDGRSSGPRLDLWQQLQDHYAQIPHSFISIEELLGRMRQREMPVIEAIQHDPLEDDKWQSTRLLEVLAQQKRHREIPLMTRNWFLWLAMHHSDYFNSESSDWIFRTRQGGVIRIVKKQIYREPELRAKMDLLEGKSYQGEDQDLANYLDKLIQLYDYLEREAHAN